MRYPMKYLRKIDFLIAILVLAVSACGAPQASPSGSQGFNLYSISDDVKLGEQVERQQLTEFNRKGIRYDQPQDRATYDRLKGILDRVVRVSDMPNLPYTFHFVEAPLVNAFCMPGGKVFLYKGLYDPKKGLVVQSSDAEFAAVLGHEYAHATNRHVTRQLSRYQSYSLIGTIAGSIIGASVGQGLEGLFSRVYSLGGLFYFPRYSRQFETEADLVGARFMAKAGYDPRVAVTLWQRAAERRKAEGKSDKTSIFASHPAGGERAKRLEAAMPTILPFYAGSH